jgi:NAD(P)-dependent dehydrogenase (short-subunit alcohol dehydrogenase family)
MEARTMNWTAKDIPDQTAKTAIVTGANVGLGLETARALAAHGTTVILACRNLEKATAAKMGIQQSVPNAKLEVIQLDLADLASVRAFATAFKTKFEHLDILVNNAGIMGPPFTKTKDGFEMQFGANHLGHFALTGLLLEKLWQTPGARVVVVSSAVERGAKIDFENLHSEKSYSPFAAYGQSKLSNLLFCYELGRRFQKTGINAIAAAAHPGWTATNLQQNAPQFKFLNPIFAQTPVWGALPSLYAATASDVQNGDYFGPSGFLEMRGTPKRVQSTARSHDFELAKKLWDISESLTGVTFTMLKDS